MNEYVPDSFFTRLATNTACEHVKLDTSYTVRNLFERHFGPSDMRIVCERKNEDTLHVASDSRM